MVDFHFQPIFEHQDDATPYRKLTSDFVRVAEFEGRSVLCIDPEALTLVAREAMRDVSFLLRPGHLAHLQVGCFAGTRPQQAHRHQPYRDTNPPA